MEPSTHSTLAFVCFAFIISSLPAHAESPGLQVHKGVVTLNGEPFRGIGVNCYDLFYRRLLKPDDPSWRESLRRLSEAGIPFLRFSCGGFWPLDWELYLKNKNRYFELLDEIVGEAKEKHVGLIPSIIWHWPTVSDLVGEPVDQWGNPESKTIAFLRSYTQEVVARYKDSPAIWGWEFGNELNLIVDLPNAAEHRPWVVPPQKTATTRSARDELHSADMLAALSQFAATVRKMDSQRILITGHSLPRSCAWHNTHDHDWKPDTLEQFEEILRRDNPDPFDSISVHIYPETGNRHPVFAKDFKTLIQTIQKAARQVHKPLFIGEFGVPIGPDSQKTRVTFEELLSAIETSGAPLAALWVYDYPPQNKDWNVTFTNDRAYMLNLISEANRRLANPPR